MEDNALIKSIVDKTIYVAEQIKALSSKGSALSVSLDKNVNYLRYLVYELGKRCITHNDASDAEMKEASESGQWITTKNNKHIHINESGEADIGNKQIRDMMNKESTDTEKTDDKTRKEHPRFRSMRCEDVVKFNNFDKVNEDHGITETHFCHDEDTMYVAKDVHKVRHNDVFLKMPFGRIEHITVFAAEDIPNKLKKKIEFADMFPDVNPKLWKHVKGIGYIINENGDKVLADIHWFENPEYGQFGWKVKEYVSDMYEYEKYWLREKE